ncbi:hypothetical protein IQ241_15495 [Romeria aff. gracilis LEGE 07310]|uniref:Uncharacterized protein n=1 Tax=Vasconcelosia minhoensis LEGE 07310 TaxID=915328 RepID=A0A8J7DMG2_9CYAN|nr:hypothetical protein [Romeria gracilis]MBE9078681.1 hypothetical protein [Romeria aff. gracilis LEGE 07310]
MVARLLQAAALTISLQLLFGFSMMPQPQSADIAVAAERFEALIAFKDAIVRR